MNLEKISNYQFENDFLCCESFIKGFSDKNFKEFDKAAKKIGLTKRIDDLISGKVVNNTENQSALHPKYRSFDENIKISENLIDAEVIASKFFSSRWNECKSNGYKSINIVTLGIGGSFEGPKLLLESLNSPISLTYFVQMKLLINLLQDLILMSLIKKQGNLSLKIRIL